MDRRLIKAARAALGWSQPGLAERAGVQRLVVARYELGTQVPHPSNMAKLVAALRAAGIKEIKHKNGARGILLDSKLFAHDEAGRGGES